MCGVSGDRWYGFGFVSWLFGGCMHMVGFWLCCLCHCFFRSWRGHACVAFSVEHKLSTSQSEELVQGNHHDGVMLEILQQLSAFCFKLQSVQLARLVRWHVAYVAQFSPSMQTYIFTQLWPAFAAPILLGRQCGR